MRDIKSDFKRAYPTLIRDGIVVDGVGEIDDISHIYITVPFIFDNRRIPYVFETYRVRRRTFTPLPFEFQIDQENAFWYKKAYLWAPERYEKFVDRCRDEIREKLGNPAMTRSEMLSALCGEDFEEYKKRIYAEIEKGKLPPYKDG